MDERRNLFTKFLRFYRIHITGRAVNYYINRYFEPKGVFVECGSGRSETTLKTEKKKRQFIALDYSESVLKKTITNPKIDKCINADIFSMPFGDNSVDGIWNVGVMEHYHMDDIHRILTEFRRVLKNDGNIILFWPMAYAPYEIVINTVEFIVNKLFKRRFTFYIDEVSRLRSKKQAKEILEKNKFRNKKVYFNFRDAFSMGVVIGTK